MDQMLLPRNPWRVSHFLPLVVTYVTMCGWHYRVAGEMSAAVAGWLFVIVATAVLVGEFFSATMFRKSPRLDTLSMRLLTGLLLSNLLLFISAMVLPFGLAINSLVLLAIVFLLWLGAKQRGAVRACREVHVSEQILFPFVAVAVTLWCWDTLRPVAFTGGSAVIQAWPDIFYHLSQISSFGFSRGPGTLFDVQMAGATMQPYHMASYILAASAVDATGVSAYVAYASLLLPLGVFAMLLGAYALACAAFGNWPALAGALALTLLPDAVQQGFGNPFLGFHWLQLIAPSMMYGVASSAVIFALLLEACRSGRVTLVMGGYFFVLVTLVYKAQIFVAVSLLALVLPMFFLQGRWRRYRTVLVVGALCVYFGAAAISQISSSVPTLRLDGSGLGPYSSVVMGLQDEGVFKHLFQRLLALAADIWPIKALIFSLLLLVCTFGVYLPVYICLMYGSRVGTGRLTRVFPLLVVTVYLVMATCLALDERRVGTMEELLHRPFVWAYFVVVVFFGATLYARVFGDAPPARAGTRIGLLALALLLLGVPLHYGERIQTIRAWQPSYPTLPTCQVEIAQYIREHSRPGDIVQDSLNDPTFRLTALTQRRPYALDAGGVRSPAGIRERLDDLVRIKAIESGQDLLAAMQVAGIRWYVVNPGDSVKWIQRAQRQKVQECGGYQVFKF